MRLLLSLAASVAAAVVLPGCGTLITSSLQKVKTTSRPAGAEVLVDGMPQGNTPTVVEVSRWEDHDVTIELRGYRPYQVHLKRILSRWNPLNMANGFIPGLIVDGSTGAIYEMNPNEIHVDLFPSGVRRHPLSHDEGHASATASGGDRLAVSTTDKAQAHWHKIGQMERM